SVRGLDLHRDKEQVFVLQLDGRKRWLLYGFSLEGIDASALTTSAALPGGAVLDEILTPGDLLYIPRGCYHLAVPLNEPPLHATVSVKDPGEPGGHAKRRPSFTLPWSAAPGTQLDGAHVSIVLKAPIDEITGGESGSLHLQSRGHAYRFPRAMRALLDELDDERPRPIGEIVDALARVLDADTVRLFVAMLVREGLVVVVSTSRRASVSDSPSLQPPPPFPPSR